MLCQIYEHGRGLAFHFDKDEHLLKEEGTMMHPIVNSIIYLTGDSAKSRQGTHRSLKSGNLSLLSPMHCSLQDAHVTHSSRESLRASQLVLQLAGAGNSGVLKESMAMRPIDCLRLARTLRSQLHSLWLPGPTVVVDQQHCSSGGQGETPRRSLLAYPCQNSLLMFDGRLGHGVLDTLGDSTRMTLLINWWHHRPKVKASFAAEALCGA